MTLTRPDQAARAAEALADRLVADTSAALTLFTVHVGDQLGYYRVLADDGPLSSAELAARSGTRERLAREWLEQQCVAGLVACDRPEAPPAERRFHLPPGHERVLADPDDLHFLGGLAQVAVGATKPVDQLLDAFRSGGGVPYGAYGRDLRVGQARMNRAPFLRQLGNEWLPAVADVHARISSPGARVADVGCGCGWSSIGIAEAYPTAAVEGFDLDAPSIAEARAHAEARGVADRVRFHVRDAADPAFEGAFDLALALECVHDLGDPVAALRAMGRMVRPGGAVIVMDERVSDAFTGRDDTGLETFMYGFSVLHCLPVGLADGGCCGGTGTVMRRPLFERYARESGFASVEVLPIEHALFRFYRLHR